jgi:hypothetical protein
MADREFPKHFDGRRFYNPGGPSGFLDALRWKLTSRSESSPSFVADVAPPPGKRRVRTETQAQTQTIGNSLSTFINNDAA